MTEKGSVIGTVEFNGYKSRDDAHLQWGDGVTTVRNTSFELRGASPTDWETDMQSHEGDAIFETKGWGEVKRYRIPNARVLRSGLATIELIAQGSPEPSP